MSGKETKSSGGLRYIDLLWWIPLYGNLSNLCERCFARGPSFWWRLCQCKHFSSSYEAVLTFFEGRHCSERGRRARRLFLVLLEAERQQSQLGTAKTPLPISVRSEEADSILYSGRNHGTASHRTFRKLIFGVYNFGSTSVFRRACINCNHIWLEGFWMIMNPEVAFTTIAYSRFCTGFKDHEVDRKGTKMRTGSGTWTKDCGGDCSMSEWKVCSGEWSNLVVSEIAFLWDLVLWWNG